jgi:hypothetical protein
MLSVRDIQGNWRESKTNSMWSVHGIIARKSRKRCFVLSDGPGGVDWGNTNLIGNLEDGWLVWRNHRGDAMHSWQKVEEPSEVTHTGTMTATRTSKHKLPNDSLPQAPTLPNLQIKAAEKTQTKMEHHSPRSTNSGASIETATLPDGMGSVVMNDVSYLNTVQDDDVFAEMKLLLEMAANRLMAGDVDISMRYIALAQQIQPLSC